MMLSYEVTIIVVSLSDLFPSPARAIYGNIYRVEKEIFNIITKGKDSPHERQTDSIYQISVRFHVLLRNHRDDYTAV